MCPRLKHQKQTCELSGSQFICMSYFLPLQFSSAHINSTLTVLNTQHVTLTDEGTCPYEKKQTTPAPPPQPHQIIPPRLVFLSPFKQHLSQLNPTDQP